MKKWWDSLGDDWQIPMRVLGLIFLFVQMMIGALVFWLWFGRSVLG